jgi:hypothetical protein
MAELIRYLPERALTIAGALRSGAGFTAEFFLSGTTTPVTVYQDDDLAVPHPSPVVADANGVFPAVFTSGVNLIKAVVKTGSGVTFATIDPCPRTSLESGSAGSITFAPTDDVLATNVQDAIEEVSGYFSAFGRTLVDDEDDAAARVTLGLGAAISGSSLSVDNANNATSSGFYTLASPFTNGPTAAAYRILTIRTSADEMTQIAASGGAVWYRTRTGGTWGAWARLLDPPSLKTELSATGSAPIFACRAWVNFNGTGTVAIRGSGNVSSITDDGTGLYTVNFATAMPDANYAAVVTGGNDAGTASQFATLAGVPAAGSVQVGYHLTGTGAADAEFMNVTIFR